MKLHLKSAAILVSLSCLAFASCNSKRGQPRDEQLEDTAVILEVKADKVLVDVEQSAEKKLGEAKVSREEKGDEKTAEHLEKDARVIREAGKLHSEQLKKQAGEVREQKE